MSLARKDVEHGGEPFGMSRRQSLKHVRRFPKGLFVDELEKQLFQASRHSCPGLIEITVADFMKAIRRGRNI